MFHRQREATERLYSSINMLKKKFAYEPQVFIYLKIRMSSK